ncbi:hypothetical protein [Burkholderia sp. BCC0397]|uniref:hypothetical protein n=1 Tax=Burkholderia sp. BCC0397 TaxID=486876 RepID=UPI00158B1A8F|nr:hypothetical protein [Burkholderia sp. BCC0397]
MTLICLTNSYPINRRSRSAIGAPLQVRGVTLADEPDPLQRRLDRGEIVDCRSPAGEMGSGR